MFGMNKPGMRVLISRDCREGEPATGKYGTMEGDFPLTVSFGYQPTENDETKWADGEWDYGKYKSGELKLKTDGRHAKDVFIEWEQGQPQPRPYFAMVHTNPRIRLDDGSVIWGAECWWGPAKEGDGLTLEEAQKRTDETIEVLQALAKAIEEGDNATETTD